MLLQKGRFLIKDIDELSNLDVDKDGLKKVIDLAYMGQYEYEGNAIPISRMFIEYYKEKYEFYPTDIYNKNNEQMYVFVNRDLINEGLDSNPNYIADLVKHDIDKNMSLWEHINHKVEESRYDFWWNIEADYLIFFGDAKKEIINYFINSCYDRDGMKEGLQKKLSLAGYKLES